MAASEQEPERDAGPDECDVCGVSALTRALYETAPDESGHQPFRVRAFRYPADVERVCGPCAEEANIHTADDLTDDELVAAIVDDSIGYATPRHAARHVADYRAGETRACCERGNAVYGGDLDALIESARRHWMARSDERRAELLERIEAWREVEAEDQAAALGVSMGYPTGGV